MLDSKLERAFSLAVGEAQKLNHEYVTLEHLLFGILSEESGRIMLDELGVNTRALHRSLEVFFSENLPSVAHITEVVQTIALQRVIQRSLRQMQAAGRDKIGIGDVLVCLLDEETSFAAYYLLSQGISRLDVLEYISYNVAGSTEPVEDDSLSAQEKALHTYTVDLTQKAKEGKLDPLIGRGVEIQRTIQILARRRKNNPLFVGEPGVGKTAMAEGLAQLIINGKVPKSLRKAQLFSLDLAGMMAGAKYRGDFEGRMKAVMGAIEKIPHAILFIDEIHTVVGAGAVSGGSLDASNILKPALASGELRCIGSTTHEELRTHFEKDKAFSRRFQKVNIPEPSHVECLDILKGLKSRYEKHHDISYTPAALEAAVTLSAQYLTESHLPDKAIDLIDEAGARKNLSRKEQDKNKKLSVNHKDIEEVVAIMARIPSVRASSSDKASLKMLKNSLKKVVFGQDDAIEKVVRATLRSRAGFTNADRPQGSFLFFGPTGVGKTELAKQLAASLGVTFLRYDMSEYMERHAVARLIGAPPGYVGYEEGGLLTEAIRKSPNAVLLLDEMEKAHPDIFNVLLQVMDYATLTDSSGRVADFRAVTIIMTTNAGAFEMSARNIGFGLVEDGQTGRHSTDKAKKALERLFTPEFRNRLDAMVAFTPLSRFVMKHIVDKFILELSNRLLERDVKISFSDIAKDYFAMIGYDPVFGARPLARVMREEIEDPLSAELLFGKLAKGGSVFVDLAAKTSKKEKVSENYIFVQDEGKLVFTYGSGKVSEKVTAKTTIKATKTAKQATTPKTIVKKSASVE